MGRDTSLRWSRVPTLVGAQIRWERDYGGGCAARRRMRFAMKPNQDRAGCTQTGNPLFFIAATVASNPGDFG